MVNGARLIALTNVAESSHRNIFLDNAVHAEAADIIDFDSQHSACALPLRARLTVVLIDETSPMPLPLWPGPDRNSPATNRLHSAVECHQRSAAYSKAKPSSSTRCFSDLETCRNMSPTARWQFSETRSRSYSSGRSPSVWCDHSRGNARCKVGSISCGREVQAILHCSRCFRRSYARTCLLYTSDAAD